MNDLNVISAIPRKAAQPESTRFATKRLIANCKTVEGVKEVLRISLLEKRNVNSKTKNRWKKQAQNKIKELTQ